MDDATYFERLAATVARIAHHPHFSAKPHAVELCLQDIGDLSLAGRITAEQAGEEKGEEKDCHAGFGLATAARTLPGLAGGEVVGDIRPVTTGPMASSVAKGDHHSPHWLIRGVTPHCRIRRWVIRQSARLFGRRQSATGT
jgi:hypothetical protein